MPRFTNEGCLLQITNCVLANESHQCSKGEHLVRAFFALSGWNGRCGRKDRGDYEDRWIDTGSGVSRARLGILVVPWSAQKMLPLVERRLFAAPDKLRGWEARYLPERLQSAAKWRNPVGKQVCATSQMKKSCLFATTPTKEWYLSVVYSPSIELLGIRHSMDLNLSADKNENETERDLNLPILLSHM